MSTMPPVRRDQFRTQAFLSWLAHNGCEIGTPTNAYEVVRYRAFWQGSAKAVVHIVYAKENGLLTYMGGSKEHYILFAGGCDLHTNAPPKFKKPKRERGVDGKGTGKTGRRRENVASRQGDECWFCGLAMGADCTLEHLIPRSKGGNNHAANVVNAHFACNQKAADMDLADKIALRERLRAKLEQPA